MLPLKANMVGYKGHISARIEQKGTGYDNKALHKITKPHFTPKKSLIPFSFNSSHKIDFCLVKKKLRF